MGSIRKNLCKKVTPSENWRGLFYLFSPLDEDLPEIRTKKRVLLVGIAVAATSFLLLLMNVGFIFIYALFSIEH